MRDWVGAPSRVQFCRARLLFIVMVRKPLKSVGRGATSLFKFVYLEDLSGLMQRIDNNNVNCIHASNSAFPPQS